MLTDDQRQRYEVWVLAVVPRATAFARSLTRNPAEADDVVQECLLHLLRRATDYNLERDGLKLLFKSISNRCINNATRNKELVSLDSPPDADGPANSVVDRFALRPEQIAQNRELEDAVRAGLLQLPPLQRAAVELRALGFSKEEIGESLGVSPTNAGVLVFRGRKTLAELLRPFLPENDFEESV